MNLNSQNNKTYLRNLGALWGNRLTSEVSERMQRHGVFANASLYPVSNAYRFMDLIEGAS